MDWCGRWESPFQEYVESFAGLIGDQRTKRTFAEILKGIVGGGSLVCEQIARHSPVLSRVKHGTQRVIRLAKGQSTRRSQLTAEPLVSRLRERGLAQLKPSSAEGVWLILDQSNLCKPYAQEMPELMYVLDLDKRLVPGYRTMNVLGVTPGRRGLLYHHLYSSEAEDFVSESMETRVALQTTLRALREAGISSPITWIMDRDFDDVAAWRTIWEDSAHLLCRVKHTERLVRFRQHCGSWQEGDIAQACAHLQPLVQCPSEMKMRLGRQKRAKRQTVQVSISACPLELVYDQNVRRPGAELWVCKALWLVRVAALKAHEEPWLLITDWPVEDAEMALQIFRMYRERWAIEDSFHYTKTCLGWEEVQLLHFEAVRTLVAMSWVAAGFLYELGVTLDWPEVQLLARLGGWTPHKDRRPGRIVITRGLAALLHTYTTEAILQDYIHEHGGLPPGIAALIRDFGGPDLC
jgi:hypothetical protein